MERLTPEHIADVRKECEAATDRWAVDVPGPELLVIVDALTDAYAEIDALRSELEAMRPVVEDVMTTCGIAVVQEIPEPGWIGCLVRATSIAQAADRSVRNGE